MSNAVLSRGELWFGERGGTISIGGGGRGESTLQDKKECLCLEIRAPVPLVSFLARGLAITLWVKPVQARPSLRSLLHRTVPEVEGQGHWPVHQGCHDDETEAGYKLLALPPPRFRVAFLHA